MNFRKSIMCFVMLVFCGILAFAQKKNESFEQYQARRKQEFKNYKTTRQKEFEEYRRKRNEEFAEYLRKTWTPINPSPIKTKPKEKPVPPLVTPQNDTLKDIKPKPLPYDEVIPTPKPQPQPQPINPIEESPKPIKNELPQFKVFYFFGTEGKVRFEQKSLFHLDNLNENSIANAWLKLSQESYTNLIYDCLQIRKDNKLCDWAYLQMLQQMSESVFGKNTNEAVLLMSYVYCQSGYKMRLAIGEDNKLYMLFASEHILFDWNFFTLDGDYYYTYNNKTGKVRVCNQAYPKEQNLSLLVSSDQSFLMQKTKTVERQSKRNKEMHISLTVNQNMLDFYSSYPTSFIGQNIVTRWAMYANTPMPHYIKEAIYPQIKAAIAGDNQWVAVNKILNFIQTGFEYEYDDKVWGGDRAFFPEESLYYPYCDCEDRSILLTRIIRDLLGLKCILVFYPGHLASAVAFTEGTPTGDYIEYQNQRFFIADGTIIGYGAPVGTTMNNMDNKTAKIILLN